MIGLVQTSVSTWQWWICIVLSILPWWFWWKYKNKFYWKELLYSGAIITIITCILDTVGYKLGYWRCELQHMLDILYLIHGFILSIIIGIIVTQYRFILY
ncbi:hypothetical protein ASG93_19220 [Paenibacillus sp. Soil787]|nr:hypothetical protein ASG93_19220 [Paenibacillus sp. Soil787]